MDEVKALGLAAFINFMIYYIVGSLLVIISINEKKYKSLLYYLKVHGTMTCGIVILGPIFAHNFGNQRSLIMVIADAIFRFYSLGCIYSLYKKFKHEHHEREKMEASEKAFASYGTADAIDHHATVEEHDERRK
ncbi:hypothetical protein PVAND_015148 [Polypedilum vanderplanki]|uniref:Uncharacterized protein n=1 Tax=Polypedilum vanderplanki TaxID=319348 RepID=A0A9J6BBV7_POLVA|nr:hypothetical protein PVAND_015148 [Polypedilum vanderplanki]